VLDTGGAQAAREGTSDPAGERSQRP
jgi:hypothetical protein